MSITGGTRTSDRRFSREPRFGQATGLQALKAKARAHQAKQEEGRRESSGPIPVAGEHSVLATREKKILYCICYEGVHNGQPFAAKEHNHSVDGQEALAQFWMGHLREKIRVVGCAPVIGYFALDEDGKKLTV